MSPILKSCVRHGLYTPTSYGCPACDRERGKRPQRQARSGRRYQTVRAQAKTRDGYRCRSCGAGEPVEAHHVIPLLTGGADTLDNLITLCPDCHRDQHAGTGGGVPPTSRRRTAEHPRPGFREKNQRGEGPAPENQDPGDFPLFA